METKLWFALCALLATHLASADDGQGVPAPRADEAHMTHGPTSAPAVAPDGNGTQSSNDSRANDTGAISSPNSTGTPPTGSPPGNQTSTSTVLPIVVSSSALNISHTTPVNMTNTTQPANTTAFQPVTNSTTNMTNSEPPEAASTTNASTNATSATPRSPQGQPTTTHTTQTISHSSTTQDQKKSSPSAATSQTSSPPEHTKAHSNTPSQLNVGGDTTMVHKSTTLDPLLAGLVSAFIITAVIITVLLFLKLRRRDSRPEFRRLQDLPMDDMEDTPLSMYTY